MTLGDNPQARASAYASRLEDSLPDHEWDRIRTATQQGEWWEVRRIREAIGRKVGRSLIGETGGRPNELHPTRQEYSAP